MTQQAVAYQTDVEQQKSDHDMWFREQVEVGVQEADDPNTVWVSHEQVMQDLEELRHEWRSETAKKRMVD